MNADLVGRLYVGPHGVESEAEFWRRVALERAQRITELERVVANLRDAIAEYEAVAP